jgi:hypothetical protein
MEDPVVFQKEHELALRLVRESKVAGLRVDHPDGFLFLLFRVLPGPHLTQLSL